MKELLASTIGDTKLAREFYGIHKAISGRMLKYEIYKDDRPCIRGPCVSCIDDYSDGYKEEGSS